ncbi:MAG: M48 family metalloprotease [Thermomonas sp.]|uniref:M48 family metalloprotease n=1 Tax=Thermomonas sp. TaxID=1971895 RepID=UPI001DE015B4|nr:M48 family metalloprotease [Thermomonas sp.]MBZ0087977.1 M48 family metalloprotease [Thermomonas sp.]
MKLSMPRILLATLILAFSGLVMAATGGSPATVAKPKVDVHAAASFGSPTVTTLRNKAAVSIVGQEGLWFKIALDGGQTGYVRVNEVRVAYGKSDSGGIGAALFTGRAGQGRTTETASVRGLDESTLKSAHFDAAQLERMESYRVSAAEAQRAAERNHWVATSVPFASEFKPSQDSNQNASSGSSSRASSRTGLRALGGALSSFLPGSSSGVASAAANHSDAIVGKSDAEVLQEELELGPMLAGRILGAAPLVNDPAIQRRVNLIGRWLASQTSRPDLPWTFGVIDDGEVNAFAAPGGYILITKGLYDLLTSDAEVAAVLGHELSHVVQRDHYEVIRKQELQATGREAVMSQVNTGGGLAGSLARDFIERNGAAIMMTQLDRNAEYRADQAAGIYLARGGFNPLELYAVLQKMASLGSSSSRMASLYKTHPPLDKRLDALDKRGYGDLQAYLDR